MVDEFVFFDTAQYTKNDWRNRNKLKTKQGVIWLTIPVKQSSLSKKISEAEISDLRWAEKHWKTISQNYSKASFFRNYKDVFEDFYVNNLDRDLSSINSRLIKLINSILCIDTKITWSSDYELIEGKTEKILGICEQAGADIYLSGPAAKDYFDMNLAEQKGIQVEWMDYSGYPEYQQLSEPFEHSVTILDLIFNEGPNAKNFMKSFK